MRICISTTTRIMLLHILSDANSDTLHFFPHRLRCAIAYRNDGQTCYKSVWTAIRFKVAIKVNALSSCLKCPTSISVFQLSLKMLGRRRKSREIFVYKYFDAIS